MNTNSSTPPARPERPDIEWIGQNAFEFQTRLEAIKQSLPSRGFDWYPYDSLGSLFTLNELLTGDSRYLLELLSGGPVLDLGCADGDLAFYLESLGCRVHAIDNPRTNFNGLRGARTLKQVLSSAVEIYEEDVDTYFTLPERRYRAAFLFGILYHLKNPFYVLETLSRHARYCFLTTRIARFAPDRTTPLNEIPVAYLVDRRETNDDPTNFWIFSEAGLLRLLDRTNWIVRDFRTVGNTADSDPASWQGDERAFCFAERRLIDKVSPARLVSGWHDLEEEGSWRWTGRRFSAIFAPAPSGARAISMSLTIPESHIGSLGSMTLNARVNGQQLEPVVYASPGSYVYTAPLPDDVAGKEILLEFELDRALRPRAEDARELGIVVSKLELV